MLILITSEENFLGEQEQLMDLFKNGLSLLHIRKPGMSRQNLELWISQFDRQYLKKMVLHDHHDLALVYPFKGIHFKEKDRLNVKELQVELNGFRHNGLSLSSSFHDLGTLSRTAGMFDYTFLSPVFTSISKNDYPGRGENVAHIKSKVIALGGIDQNNIKEARNMGYSGVAILGSVWKSRDKSLTFKNILDEYNKWYPG